MMYCFCSSTHVNRFKVGLLFAHLRFIRQSNISRNQKALKSRENDAAARKDKAENGKGISPQSVASQTGNISFCHLFFISIAKYQFVNQVLTQKLQSNTNSCIETDGICTFKNHGKWLSLINCFSHSTFVCKIMS